MSESHATAHALRKSEHLTICIEDDVEPRSADPGFDNYVFIHEALPEIDLQAVSTACDLFGHPLAAPFIISSMTGGTDEAADLNRLLAEAAQETGVAMGIGSQRVALMDPELAKTFRVRDVAPDIFLFANIGAIQLNNGFTVDHCRRAVEMIEADALMLHLNPLQESVQSGGNTNFSGLAAQIEQVCARLEVPVLVKEVGQGISERTARLLRNAGVSGLDTAGTGGTSWALVESLRETSDKSTLGCAFAGWGIPTADSIIMARRGASDITLIASGGIRSGIDAAKALALGADLAGFALPLLRAATEGISSVIEHIKGYTEALRVAMFCIGAKSIAELRLGNSLACKHSRRSGRGMG